MKEFYEKMVNNKKFQIVKKVISTIATILLVLIFIVILVQKITNNRLNLGGYGVYTVATGSMDPVYKVKDLILASKTDAKNINIGDDVVYVGKEGGLEGKIITHRVINKSEHDGQIYFYTKGVANALTDPEIDETQVLGVVKCKLHILSLCSHIVNSTIGLIVVIVIPFIIFVFFEGKRMIDDANKE